MKKEKKNDFLIEDFVELLVDAIGLAICAIITIFALPWLFWYLRKLKKEESEEGR